MQRLLFMMRRAAVGTALLALTAWPAAQAHAQGALRPLTGRVIDGEDKAPIPAASIQVIGTTLGTTTTDSGTFSLRVPQGAATLTIRRIGFRAVTVIVAADQGDVAVSLARDILELQQQVVTGVATSVASENAANDVAVVTSANLNRAPAPTIENALQGKVPGAVIQQNNGGDPGGGMQVQIRGITSIFANAFPLYVVDGVIVNNETVNSGLNTITQSNGGAGSSTQDMSPNRIADLNPEDIESIEILKGASASAIYGSKASAGVIIITTKKGKAGKPRIELSQKVGQFDISNTYGLRTFPTLASARRGATNTGMTPPPSRRSTAARRTTRTSCSATTSCRTRPTSASAGHRDTRSTSCRGSPSTTTARMLNTGYNKQTIRSNITQTFFSNLSATANLNFAHSVTRRGVSGNDNIGVQPVRRLLVHAAVRDAQHSKVNGAWPINPFGPANPFADAVEIQTPETVNRFIGGGNIDWEPLRLPTRPLHVTFIGGADYTTQNDTVLRAARSAGGAGDSVGAARRVHRTATRKTTYLNYSINLVHHYTGLSLLDATTSVGLRRGRQRSLDNPLGAGQDLLAGANNPTVGAVQTLNYTAPAAKDQSLYAQEQVLTLSAAVGADRGRHRRAHDERRRHQQVLRLPAILGVVPRPAVRRLPRRAQGARRLRPVRHAAAHYGVKYTPFNVTVVRADWSASIPNLGDRRLDDPAGAGDGDRDRASTRRCSSRARSSASRSTRSRSTTCSCRSRRRPRSGTTRTGSTAASSPTRASSCR